MRTFKGTISEGDRILVEGVTVYLEEVTEQPSGLRSWYGAFQLATHEFIHPAGGPYRLKLDDNRSGDIMVTNTTLSFPNDPTRVSFRVMGNLA